MLAGPRLLLGLADGPSLPTHRAHHPCPPHLDAAALGDLARRAALLGRGGAGFPFATKLAAAAGARGRATVVVNLAEGEPASSKDAALAMTRPHLVLDGAVTTARALGSREVHVVLPGDRPGVGDRVRQALEERRHEDPRLRWRLHCAAPRFVSGQARAVLELLSGRENLPVTAWRPEAVEGHRGRPTLLCNGETFAQVATLVALGPQRYAALGRGADPGTCLLTIAGDGPRPVVVEVAHGTPWGEVLAPEVLGAGALVGGYHGTWARADTLLATTVSRPAMLEAGLTLGAGVVLPLASGECPVRRTARVVDYLAAQSARRCGPCLNGLPALAAAVRAVDEGTATTERAEALARTVTGRGACAHPDGTARLVSSMLSTWWPEVRSHAGGRCTFAGTPVGQDLVAVAR